jgi:FG-GAP-like repeat
MIPKSLRLIAGLVALGATFIALTANQCNAAATYLVRVQTAGLIAGSFNTLDFHFNDGGDGTNNTASISHLNFGTATPLEDTSDFSLVDAYPDIQTIDFQAGSGTSFLLTLTTNPNLNIAQPDSFFLSLFDGHGNPTFGTPPISPTKQLLEIDEPTVVGGFPNVQVLNASGVNVSVTPVLAKDFNGDAQADLVWQNSVTGQRAIWFLNKGNFVSSIFLPSVSTDWQIVGVADFNGDGQADLVWENTVTGQRAIWLLNNGTIISSFYLPTVSTDWHIAGAADFEGTGQAGLVWENTITGQRAIWFMHNGVFVSSIFLPSVSTDWHIAGAADFNGDGQADLVWENSVTGQRGIWFLNRGVFSSSIFLPTISTDWHIAGAADFGATGQAGLVWENRVTGQRGIWFLKNGTVTSTTFLATVPTSWQIVDH